MATKKKLLQAAAGQAGGAGLDVESVFSTYLYDGTGSAQTITNGIDLDGEGGLVWIKTRNTSTSAWHSLSDTERGAGYILRSDLTNAQTGQDLQEFTSFNSNGFTVGNDDQTNGSGRTYASWTFRKAPKFFDVVTWTGDGTGARTISHNLGATVGSLIVKKYSTAGQDWFVYHRSAGGADYVGFLNESLAFSNPSYNVNVFNNTAPTDSVFSVASYTNQSGETYVAYLFAHNDGDGDFGPDGDADIIKCGSFTESSSEQEINLGFEPQWLMIKTSSTTMGWRIFDMMRGFDHGGNGTTSNANLEANSSGAEGGSSPYFKPTPTGFTVPSGFFGSGTDYIYIAIRRGTKVPESATEVFNLSTANRNTNINVGFPLDAWVGLNRDSTTPNMTSSRLTNTWLETNSTVAEDAGVSSWWTGQNDFLQNYFGDVNRIEYLFRRAPNFFDVVAYSGNGTAGRTVSHNLGVAPEMMWVKQRDNARNWAIYHSSIGNTGGLLFTTTAIQTTPYLWDDTSPQASLFTLGQGNETNRSGGSFIAYLFASLPGISKVGSYTGNGTSQTIDCGFTSGARFILVKRTDSTGDWYVWDTERGIVAGNDPYLELNTTDAEVTSTDWVDPDNSGFIVNGTTINASSAEYIFYAIA